MATKGADRLYELLPAVYREQDAENGFPLRGLTELVGDQLDLVEADIAQLWSDLFVETCRNWVIPYIGDLVSNNLLFDGGRGSTTANELFPDLAGPDLRPPVAIRTRADVAKTIYYRRRKGTLPMLEELARDVTGWPAHAVEFFELLGWTQHLEHFRPQACWFDIRSHERDERVDGAFDEASHTVDVAPISTFDGWHSIKNIGFFLWRLVPNRLFVDARQSSTTPWGFYFSPLGNPAPLFTHPRREDEETRLSTELHVPEPIRRAFFGLDLSLHQGLPPPDFTSLYGLPSDPGLAAPPILSGRREPVRDRRSDPGAPCEPALPQARCLAGDASHRQRGLDRRRERTARPRDGLRRDEAGASVHDLRLPGDAGRRRLRASGVAREAGCRHQGVLRAQRAAPRRSSRRSPPR